MKLKNIILVVAFTLASAALGAFLWWYFDTPIPYQIPQSTRVEIPTYEGSGQICQPDVIDFLSEYNIEKWGGYRYWMSGTPYPGSDDRFENPCLWASDDGIRWHVPDGIPEPLVFEPEGYKHRAVFRSDTCIAYNRATDSIELYHRESRGADLKSEILIHRLDITVQIFGSAAQATSQESAESTKNYPATENTAASSIEDSLPTSDFVYAVAEVPLTTPRFTRANSFLSPSVVITDDGTHLMYGVSRGKDGVMHIAVMTSADGISYDHLAICNPDPQFAISPLPDFRAVVPWHLSAKANGQGEITLLVNGLMKNKKNRIRNLFWANATVADPTQLTYPSPDAFIVGGTGAQPYCSSFVLEVDAQKTTGSLNSGGQSSENSTRENAKEVTAGTLNGASPTPAIPVNPRLWISTYSAPRKGPLRVRMWSVDYLNLLSSKPSITVLNR